MRRRRIGIVFYGLPRASQITLPSIFENIIDPAFKYGEVSIRYHLIKQQTVDNPSTYENSELKSENYDLFDQFIGETEVPNGIPERRGLSEIKLYGDAWSNEYKSLNNLLLQLHSLERATLQILETKPDIVIFARPDLLYHDSFESELARLVRSSETQLTIPNWQWAGGYNDRFCIASGDAINTVGLRVNLIADYLRVLQRPLHAERLLYFAVERDRIIVHPSPLRASRVRVGGEVKQEKFKTPALMRRIRWKLNRGKRALEFLSSAAHKDKR